MDKFNTSLVREKMVLMDETAKDGAAPPEIRSNRIYLELHDGNKTEKIVVRAQNMHVTLRFAGQIMESFRTEGLFLDRSTPYEWGKVWYGLLSNYEVDNNPDVWSAIYVNGKPLFKTVKSPFVDVVEKCALLTLDNYEGVKNITAGMLKQAGREMNITHSTNVAVLFAENGSNMRCSVMHRARGSNTTFNFIVEDRTPGERIAKSLTMSSNFLEALNLHYLAKQWKEKFDKEKGKKDFTLLKKARDAVARLIILEQEVFDFENHYNVKYRPERPNCYGIKL